jgi:DNA-directed RNA polymerase II subunit RPB3
MARKPQIKLREINLDHNRIEFELSNTCVAFANALRRVMISEVPTFAFEDVEFQQNTSPLPDEFIAHRIGLCPLVSEQVDKFKTRTECPCAGGCPCCQVVYVIDVKGELGAPRKVTTEDLRSYSIPGLEDPRFEECVKAAESIRPVKPPVAPGGEPVPITICKLGPGQVLQLIAIAKKSNGRDHAKWSPCCCAAYRLEPRVALDEPWFRSRPPELKQAFVRTCPNNVFRFVQADEAVEVQRPGNCTFCRQCQEWLETAEPDGKNDDKVILGEEPDKFFFLVESTGALQPQTIVAKALDIIKLKLEKVFRDIQSLPMQ